MGIYGRYDDMSYDELREECARRGWTTNHLPLRDTMASALMTVDRQRARRAANRAKGWTGEQAFYTLTRSAALAAVELLKSIPTTNNS